MGFKSIMDKQYFVIFCTCPDLATAERIAKAIVEEKLAACVNILPGITSVYRWQDQTQQDSELLLLIKTRQHAYSALEKRIQQLHPYEIAEIIALPLVAGSSNYLAWLNANIGEFS